MIIELKKLFRILKRLNNNLKVKLLSKNQLEDIVENISEFPDLKKKINQLSDNLLELDLSKKEESINLLLHLLIEFERYIGNLNEIYGILQKIAGNYRKLNKL